MFWAPLPGPTRAVLTFSTGFAHETVPTRGITHLVEHLALTRLGQRPYPFNGMVSALRTSFGCSGTPEQVSVFLATVTRSLGDLPLERLAAERRILRIEGESREWDSASSLQRWRFGHQGPGLTGSPEYGLRTVTPELLTAWSARNFTAGNAVLWMTGSPEDVELHLAPGELRLPTMPAPVLPGLTHVPGPGGGISMSLLVPRSMASAAAEYVLQRRLYQRLRVQDAVSYGVNTGRRHLDAANGELFVLVDGLPEMQDRLERAALDVLDSLVREGPNPEEVREWHQRLVHGQGDPEFVVALMGELAGDVLYGLPADVAALDAETAAVDADQVGDVLREGLTTLLVQGPRDSTALTERFNPLPGWSAAPIEGRRFKCVDPNEWVSLVAGNDSVGFVLDAERQASVPWNQVAAVLHYDDGGRDVIGVEGLTLEIDPTAWRDYPAALELIDAHTKPHLVVPMGEAPPRPPVPQQRTRFIGSWDTSVAVVLGGSLAFLGLFTLLLANWKTALFFSAPCLALAYPCLREPWLRKKGRRARTAPGAKLPKRPLRHLPRPAVTWTLAVCVSVLVAACLALASGAQVMPLIGFFGAGAYFAGMEMFCRMAGGAQKS